MYSTHKLGILCQMQECNASLAIKIIDKQVEMTSYFKTQKTSFSLEFTWSYSR